MSAAFSAAGDYGIGKMVTSLGLSMRDGTRTVNISNSVKETCSLRCIDKIGTRKNLSHLRYTHHQPRDRPEMKRRQPR